MRTMRRNISNNKLFSNACIVAIGSSFASMLR
jgi:hypothetical protein